MLGDTDGDLISFDDYVHARKNINADFWLTKVNTDGDITWQHTYHDFGYSFPENIIETSEGNLAFCGYNWRYSGEFPHIYVQMADAMGTSQWIHSDVNNSTQAHSIAETFDNSLVVVGGYQLTYTFQSSQYKFDKAGNRLWERLTEESFAYLVNKTVVPTAGGGFFINFQKAKIHNLPPGGG